MDLELDHLLANLNTPVVDKGRLDDGKSRGMNKSRAGRNGAGLQLLHPSKIEGQILNVNDYCLY